jgi:hypothetical protein
MGVLNVIRDPPLFFGLVVITIYSIVGVVYRLYFCPIAKFPGPKIAALTFWYEFYYDIILRGQYVYKIQELHGKYGPIVRINPYELHVSDPNYYETLCAGDRKKRERWW